MRTVADGGDELADEARLADPRRPEDGGEPAAAVGSCAVESRPQRGQLAVAPDEARRERAGEHRQVREDGEQPVHGYRPRPSADRELADRLDDGRLLDEAEGLLAQQDLAAACGLLEAG